MKKNRMCMINATGHTLLEWDVANEAEVQKAADEFAAAKSKGWAAFSQNNADIVHMREFDPNAETILYAPPLVGG
jgi:hypothetical protein